MAQVSDNVVVKSRGEIFPETTAPGISAAVLDEALAQFLQNGPNTAISVHLFHGSGVSLDPASLRATRYLKNVHPVLLNLILPLSQDRINTLFNQLFQLANALAAYA